MPQMSPMLWIMIMYFTMMIFLMFMFKMYFMNNKYIIYMNIKKPNQIKNMKYKW